MSVCVCVQAMSELSEQQEEVRQLARSSLDTLQEVSLSLSLSHQSWLLWSLADPEGGRGEGQRDGGQSGGSEGEDSYQPRAPGQREGSHIERSATSCQYDQRHTETAG